MMYRLAIFLLVDFIELFLQRLPTRQPLPLPRFRLAGLPIHAKCREICVRSILGSFTFAFNARARYRKRIDQNAKNTGQIRATLLFCLGKCDYINHFTALAELWYLSKIMGSSGNYDSTPKAKSIRTHFILFPKILSYAVHLQAN